VGENVDAAQHLLARIVGKSDFLGSHLSFLLGFAGLIVAMRTAKFASHE
jgi:hypothetical protein